MALRSLAYDKLIMSPGIDFIDVPGWDKSKLPHAWGGREQTEILQSQLQSFPVGGTFVINVPGYPFRCPPGPYERASAVADYLRVNNKNANVVILDVQPDVFVENERFHGLYTELGVEYRGNCR
ncbi:MAG: FAD/NAD(P)-binding oxidoreductase, partial [Pseudomonadota bacterium]|nr:FAD/NAD(P)-binding oxidoreductase [Pseudomonadota bacterium]